MADLTAKRTLVKSPPELWTELSEVEGLARHLGEFGDIRITKVEPEKTVAWEGEHASGTVEIEASGWGTKVTLTAEVVERGPEAVAEPEAEPATEPEAVAVTAPVAEPAPDVEPAPVVEPQPVAAPPPAQWSTEPAPPPPPPAPRWEPPRPVERAAPEQRGFLSRLLGRRSRGASPSARRAPAPPPLRREPPASWQQPAWHTRPEPTPAQPTSAPAQPTPQPEPAAAPERALVSVQEPAQPLAEPTPSPAPTANAHPQPREPEPPRTPEPALGPERALAVLEGALDNLGAAHHRPFSRG